MSITIRQIREDDAPALLALSCQLDEETKFMLLEPGERQMSVEEQRQQIREVLAVDNSMVFVAENEAGFLIGLLGAMGGRYRRNHDMVHIYIGILQAYTGQGIGRRLFETMEAWARGWGAHRLDLSVMVHNKRGLALYHRMGFAIEGAKRGALKVDGQYIDEFAMVKLLE